MPGPNPTSGTQSGIYAQIRAENQTCPEDQRLAELHAYGVLDTQSEQTFDDIVEIASLVCEAPIALVSLVDHDRQWFKAKVGLEAVETPRDVSFCAHAVRDEVDLVVPDATLDDRFKTNPLVTGEPHIRFYAGVVLRSSSGAPLGTLCVIDSLARPEGLTRAQSRTLRLLAHQVESQLEHRRAVKQSEVARGRSLSVESVIEERDAELASIALALAESEARFRAISDSMPQMVWSTLPDGFHDYYNARWYEFTGVPEGSTDGEAWNGMFHPEDQERAWSRWRHSLESGEPYEIEYRLRHRSGTYRWTLGRALPIRDASGEIIRWFGTCTDIEDLKRSAAEREVVSQELNHRIKNIFAVVSALIALSARQHPEARDFSGALRDRIQALAKAHEFVRPHTATATPETETTTLHAFLGQLLAPYGDTDGANLVIEGDDATFDDQAATPLALLFHELATNAAKYGALSARGGRILIQSQVADDGFHLRWRETGGPPVLAAPENTGFGYTLAKVAVQAQLGGELNAVWAPEGLTLDVKLPLTALHRRRHALASSEPTPS